MSDNLRAGTRGASTIIVFQAARILVQLASIPLLARLLEPEAFGLIAMVAVAISLGDLLRDMGISTASLKARELTHQQASNLFWINGTLGALGAVLLAAATPLLVRLYDEPLLGAVVPVLALVLLFNGFQVQLKVQLARANRYVAIGAIETGAQGAALVVAVVAALAGASYWALVGQLMTNSLVLLVACLIATRWRPVAPRRGVQTRPLVTDGLRIGVSNFLTYIANYAPTAIIGVRYSSAQVGFYERAYQLVVVPLQSILTPLNHVVVPTLSRERDDRGRLFDILVQVQLLIGFAGVLLYGVAAGTAPALVPFVLGDSWSESVPVLAILATGGAFTVLAFVNFWAFLAYDRERTLMRFALVTKPLSVLLVLVGSAQGIEGAAVGYAVGEFLSWPIGLLWLRYDLRLPVSKLVRGGALIVALFAVAAGSARFVVTGTAHWPHVLSLIVATLTAAALNGAIVAALPHTRRRLIATVALLRR
ncbi:lipopolysaccharide biosynthesis protein [Demequina sp. NBRC 110052]|uniref:lipopolysaccharide biosynthesis protein n=1 Tax=Demequina sp. NBRC 110052 TaxID=1570341 RepID=UPI0013566891|nr:lipopolysaccharide biosynthesis protein [Demequina sp. NBRC 110052]